mmetsp:Transcript_28049/g.32475  ORF Transcript_28049/g.32475 Transcript_28049/m.32475 type:complete len:94 (+) Transcript_28049:44-325(+)|eukprot:CAMPEP_0176433690 /NCGR_PEP_ID=MMETSP0127-20121128/16188_1 /TAXON_ID=938130 /ORGANISM="Platyophrya macrostoma, Strain WH" /LENGTH=93 /DNA_ID=CAMNT_0017816197 /DNA_START=44 /DNA_END=325 /DNA_ORIENTATION=-
MFALTQLCRVAAPCAVLLARKSAPQAKAAVAGKAVAVPAAAAPKRKHVPTAWTKYLKAHFGKTRGPVAGRMAILAKSYHAQKKQAVAKKIAKK